MATISWQVSEYLVTLRLGVGVAYILCPGGPDDLAVTLCFIRADLDLPAHEYQPAMKRVWLKLPESHFNRYLDLLRNETPIHMNVNVDNPRQIYFYLSTGSEPVGEEEFAQLS